jgi:hypothetical protein
MTAQRKFDPDIAALFIANYLEALRTAQSLATSVRRTAGLFPLDGHALDALDDDAREKLDAFRVRFSGLQDLLSNKLFRGILLLEEETPQSMLDILNAMEKRGVIKSFDDWKSARDLRNAFMHEYPDHLDLCAAALSGAYAAAGELIQVLARVRERAIDHVGLDSDDLPRVSQ